MPYYAGDYYRGDYYRGDPFLGGLFKGLGKVVGKVAGVASKIVPGLGGAALGVVSKVLAPKMTAAAAARIPMPVLLSSGGMSVGAQIPGLVPGAGVQISTPIGSVGVGKFAPVQLPNGQVVMVPRKRRRINVANPQALRRAIRRAQGFAKLSRKVLSFVDAKSPKARARFKRRR